MKKKILGMLTLSTIFLLAACDTSTNTNDSTSDESVEEVSQAIEIVDQGSFAVGGTVVTNEGEFDPYNPTEDGQTLHGDHASVRYQIPNETRDLPLVFLHGAGQSSRTWETTPDGREGFQNIFLKRNFSIYLVDQPRRGAAGRSTVPGEIPATPDEQFSYDIFRLGIWPEPFEGVQFPNDEESLNQYFRQMTPNTGEYDEAVIADSMSSLFDEIGEGVLVTHSQGGGPGWRTAIQNDNVQGVVAFEPGSGFVFPEGEVPETMPSIAGDLSGVEISQEEFNELTEIPIIIYYGDNIPEEPSDNPGQDNWRVRLDMAEIWVDTINEHGGDATLVHLPEIGITGNTHFLFSDLNNVEIADQMSEFLSEKELD